MAKKRDKLAVARMMQPAPVMAHDEPTVDVAETTPVPVPEPVVERDVVAPAVPVETAPEPRAEKTPVRRVERVSVATTQRLSVYITQAAYGEVKSAFVWSLANDPQPASTIGRWVEQALRKYAYKTPEGRQRAMSTLGPDDGGEGNKKQVRTFDVAVDVLADVEAAMDEDLDYGQPVARSSWVANAIRAYADATRVRAGGELPPAPAKLPTRSRVPMNRTN